MQWSGGTATSRQARDRRDNKGEGEDSGEMRQQRVVVRFVWCSGRLGRADGGLEGLGHE
jgi:hypothetical protein